MLSRGIAPLHMQLSHMGRQGVSGSGFESGGARLLLGMARDAAEEFGDVEPDMSNTIS